MGVGKDGPWTRRERALLLAPFSPDPDHGKMGVGKDGPWTKRERALLL